MWLNCYEKNKIIFFFIWAVIDFLTTNISWFLLNSKQHPSPISRKQQTILNVRMAWIICIVLFCIISVLAGFYSGNSRNIQNTSWRLVKKIYDTYMMCYFNLVIAWRLQGWLKGQSHILKIAIMVPRRRLSRAIAATFWPRVPECKKINHKYKTMG